MATKVIVWSFLLVLGSCTSDLSNQADNQKETLKSPPNIVWIVSEDNSPLLGCYGDTKARTPNIDALAKQGIKYNNAFANAPVCAPSRSTLITGMYPTSLGSQHMRSLVKVPDEIKFFPQYLKDAGYYTTLRVKRDYNIPKQVGTWDKDDFWQMKDAIKDRKEGQPFFMFYNTWMSHESKLHDRTNLQEYFKATFKDEVENIDSLIESFHDFTNANIRIPDYFPSTAEAKEDYAWYYKAMQMMDYEVGHILKYLRDEDLLKNTIVIYSSDHGGVLGRSKRFDYESGLHVPMIALFPDKYKHLAPQPNGTSTDRLVSFVDMAPTILRLANLTPPSYMHGHAFMGEHIPPESDIAYGFRGRMDEAYDMVRTIRNKKYRYIRNYMPYRPNGQHIEFLWKSKSMKSWAENYKNGDCTPLQKSFFLPRSSEELYDVKSDPDNIDNLINDPNLKEEILSFRKQNRDMSIRYFDAGFFSEGDLWERALIENTTIKEIIDKNKKECLAAITAAELATLSPTVPSIRSLMKSEYSSVRFWGATGAIILGDSAKELREELFVLANDSSGDVAVTSAEALYLIGETEIAIKVLIEALDRKNVYVQLRALNIVAMRSIVDGRLMASIKKIESDNEYIKKIKKHILGFKL